MAETDDPRTLEGIRQLLARYRMRPSHRLGQHFLIDTEVYETIAGLVDAAGCPWALEIGPGPGGLTRSLLEHQRRVLAVELDPGLASLLRQETKAFGAHIQVVQQDAVASDWQRLAEAASMQAPLAVVGNLPYYVTGPLVAKLWEDALAWKRAVFMLQKEVAERLAAEPGQRKAGVASVLIRYVGVPTIVCSVEKGAFYPPPEVDSAVLVVDRVQAPPVEFSRLRWWVRAGFQHRRKMLRQALSLAPGSQWDKEGWDRHLEQYGISGQRRAESLTMQEWVRLAASLPLEGSETTPQDRLK